MLSLFRAKPAVVRIQVDNPYFSEIAKLRYQIYCEELNFLDSSKYPDKKETDEYDHRSVHIAVKVGKQLGGYTRVILAGDGKLPIFENFPIALENGGVSCEISRFMIAPGFRRNPSIRREIFSLLAKETLRVVEENRVDRVYAVVEEWLYNSLRKRGFNFIKLADGMNHMGAFTYPTLLKVSNHD